MYEMLHSGPLKLLLELLLSEQSRLQHLHLMDERVRVPMLAMIESQENVSGSEDVNASDIEELFYYFSETCENVYMFLKCLRDVVKRWNLDFINSSSSSSKPQPPPPTLLDDEFFRLLRQNYRSLILFDSRHHIRHDVVSFWRESSEYNLRESNPILDRYEKTVGFWRPMSAMRLDYFVVLQTLLIDMTGNIGITKEKLANEIKRLNAMKSRMSSVIDGEKLHWHAVFRKRFRKMVCYEDESQSNNQVVAPRRIEARNLVREVAPLLTNEPCRRVIVVCMKATDLSNVNKNQTPYCKLQLRASHLNRHYYVEEAKPQSDRCETTTWASNPVEPVWNRMYMWDLQSSVVSHTLFAEVCSAGFMFKTHSIGYIEPMSLLHIRNLKNNAVGGDFVNLKVPMFKGKGSKRHHAGFLHLRISIDMDGRTRAIDRMMNSVKRRYATINPGESERRRTVTSFQYLEDDDGIHKRHYSLPPHLSPELQSNKTNGIPPKSPIHLTLSENTRHRSISNASHSKASMLLGIERSDSIRNNQISDFVKGEEEEEDNDEKKKGSGNKAIAIWAFQSTHELETKVTIGSKTHGSDLGRVQDGFGVSDVRDTLFLSHIFKKYNNSFLQTQTFQVRNSSVHLTWANHARLVTAQVTCRSTLLRHEKWKLKKRKSKRVFRTRLPFVWPPQIYMAQGHDRNTFRASMESVSSTTLLDVDVHTSTLRTYNAIVYDTEEESRVYRFNVKIDSVGLGGLRVGVCTSKTSQAKPLGSSSDSKEWSIAFTSRGACVAGGVFLRVHHDSELKLLQNDRFNEIEHRRAFEDHNRVVLKYDTIKRTLQLEVNGRNVTSPMSLVEVWKKTCGGGDLPKYLYFGISLSPDSHVHISGDSCLFHLDAPCDGQEIIPDIVQSLVVSNVSNRRPVSSSNNTKTPSVVVDGALETSWYFQFNEDTAEYPYLSVELLKSCALEAVDVLWGETRPGSYLIQVSNEVHPNVDFGWSIVADVDLRLVRKIYFFIEFDCVSSFFMICFLLVLLLLTTHTHTHRYDIRIDGFIHLSRTERLHDMFEFVLEKAEEYLGFVTQKHPSHLLVPL